MRGLLMLAICLPLRHLHLTSGYGYRIHPLTAKWAFHSGVDLSAHSDTVFCILAGVVRKAGYDARLGNYIEVEHRGGVLSTYGHLSESWVRATDTLQQSDALGLTGATGLVTGEHLHFSVRTSRCFLNPLRFLKDLLQINQKLKE